MPTREMTLSGFC